jgi:CheY-like chemotaxis protein
MDFIKTNKLLLENSSDTVAIHALLKEALGAKSVDILYYDKEKSIYFDEINNLTIQKKYLNSTSLLGHALETKKPYYCSDFIDNKNYNIAIDNPFKVALYNQVIIPIFEDNESKGIIRFSQLPKSFSDKDYTSLSTLLPAFEGIFSYTRTMDSLESQKYSKVDMNKALQQLEEAFDSLSEHITNPEIEKLIIVGRKNKEALKNYIHTNHDNKAQIQEKLKRLQSKKLYANVLIADDVRINVKILNAMLSESAIIDQIKHAYDGIETMDIINKCKEADESIHILFLDHHMPGKTGLEIAESLKEASESDATIIIVSITNDPEIIASKEYLYDYHIPKPFNKESIQKVMEEIRIDHLS